MNKKKADLILRDLAHKKSAYWEAQGKRTAARVASHTVKHVAAYKKFLKKHKVSLSSSVTFADFLKLPLTSKKDYLRKYSLQDLSYSGIGGPITYSATSGSTGKPFYFPRNQELDWQYSILLESYIKAVSSPRSKQNTLIIIGFGMGVWIGGLITYRAFEFLNERGANLSLITPGVNKKEIFNALRDLSPQYDQTILVGYPPFVKDILDEADEEGVDLKKVNLKLLFAAEAFTESFRDYVAQKAGIKNVHNETLNIYGTADIGAMAFETPTSILIRRLVLNKPELANTIFGNIKRTPTLAQYNPLFVHFECLNGEVVLTGNNEIPLVRYAVGDHGGVFSFSKLNDILKREGVDLIKEARKAKVRLEELPFVYVYERTDLSTTLYGLQIYPEVIREVLLEKRFQSALTGKFTMITAYDKKKNQQLQLHIEEKRGRSIKKSEVRSLEKSIVEALRTRNSEFRELSNFLGKRAYPKLHFWPLGHSTHFQVGAKQKWVKKT